MARAGGHDHREIVLDPVVHPVDPDHALAFLDAEELVAVLVHLLADVAAGRQRHQHQLEVLAGVEDAAEILVGDRRLLDIVDIALHISSSFNGSWPQFIRL